MLAALAEPIARRIADHLGADPETVAASLAPPTKTGAGDLALPCFRFAKDAGRPPPQLAGELAELLADGAGVEAVAAGPFLNLRFPPAELARTVFAAAGEDPECFLRSDLGEGRTVCVDFSSPNIAKHLAFHHIRSTMLGNALARCYDAAGWRTVRINFLGDWGTAFGRLIAGWKREGPTLADLDAADDKVAYLHGIYSRTSQRAEEDPALAEEARAWSKRLEDGDGEARELWQRFKEASLEEFRRVYELLDVGFDSWKGEAHYEGAMEPVLDRLRDAGLLVEDQGAEVVELDGFEKPVLMRRADGGTLYATRDLAACEDRYEEFGFDRALYVVDNGQALHFKEWFAVAEALGRPYAGRLRHVGFGVVLMWDQAEGAFVKGRSRSGGAILLTDVLDEATARARAIVEEKNPDLDGDEKDRVARAVGVGAVVFNDLKNNRRSDVRFRFEDALNMQGETGPYLQYGHARLCSIERRFAETFPDPPAGDPGLLARDDEKAVLLACCALRPALERVVADDEPHHLATALLELAATVASWLTAGNHDRTARVICDDADLAASRLALVRVARRALGRGLHLLGLRAPDRM